MSSSNKIEIQDKFITDYFQKNSINPLKFIKTYIHLDKYLKFFNNFGLNITKEIDNKLDYLIENNQQCFQSIKENHENISNQINKNNIEKLNNLFDNFKDFIDNKNYNSQQYIQQNFNDLIEELKTVTGLFKVSNKKGEQTENVMLKVISQAFLNYEVGKSIEKHSCDIFIKSEDNPVVLVEIKDYSQNVPKKEVDKFYFDINENNCCGIMISIQSGIANKKHFLIEITSNKNILIYLFNNGYTSEYIKQAINIIYELYPLLHISEFISDEKYLVLKKESIDILKKECESFLEIKNKILESMNETIKMVNSLHIKKIKNILFHSL
jgi:hypothetical protein